MFVFVAIKICSHFPIFPVLEIGQRTLSHPVLTYVLNILNINQCKIVPNQTKQGKGAHSFIFPSQLSSISVSLPQWIVSISLSLILWRDSLLIIPSV